MKKIYDGSKIKELQSKINALQEELDEIKYKVTLEEVLQDALKGHIITDIKITPKNWGDSFCKRKGFIATITAVEK